MRYDKENFLIHLRQRAAGIAVPLEPVIPLAMSIMEIASTTFTVLDAVPKSLVQSDIQPLKESVRADLVANLIGHCVKLQKLNDVQLTNKDIEIFNAMMTSNCGPAGGPRQEP